ncbi:MAG: hypothetical protein U9R23_00580 [Candidatus Cloacimonadota bacterium]|nr:hypothetical protein [Candidatus Cloacimonadota bacterium]
MKKINTILFLLFIVIVQCSQGHKYQEIQSNVIKNIRENDKSLTHKLNQKKLYFPKWFSQMPLEQDTYFAVGIAQYTRDDSLYKQSAKEMATVTISRLIKSYVVIKQGKSRYEDDVDYQEKNIGFAVCVSANPDTMNFILNNIHLLDNFRFDNYFYGLYCCPKVSIDIDSTKIKFDNKIPDWYKDVNEVYNTFYISYGNGKALSPVDAWLDARDNAMYRLSQISEIQVETSMKDKQKDSSSAIKNAIFLESLKLIKNSQILKNDIIKRYEKGDYYYTAFIMMRCER